MQERLGRPQIASSAMRRVVFWYVLRTCETCHLIDDFAHRVHARLSRTSQRALYADPLRALHVVSHYTIRSQSIAQWYSSLRLIDAAQRMRAALTKLPPRHRFVIDAIHAHARTIADIAGELRTSLGMTALYYEQARGMLRAFGSYLNAQGDFTGSSEVLIAQGAAHWLFRGYEQLHVRDQFVDWILSSPTHVRELLIGCVDEWVLHVALGWRPAVDVSR